MILILGKGCLAQAIKTKNPDANLVGLPEFDFSNQQDCDRLISTYNNPEYLINTTGVIDHDIWKNLIVNFVAPCYISSWYIKNTKCHVINISSASAWWVSYPDLDFSRFSYNIAKESLSNFGKHANRIIIDNSATGTLTTIEPGAFKSKMSGFQGNSVDQIADCVQIAIEKKYQHISCIK